MKSRLETATSLSFLPISYSPLLWGKDNLQLLGASSNYCHLWVKNAGMVSHVYLRLSRVLVLTLRWVSYLSSLVQTESEISLALTN